MLTQFKSPNGPFCPSCLLRQHPCAIATIVALCGMTYLLTIGSSVNKISSTIQEVEKRLHKIENDPKVKINKEVNESERGQGDIVPPASLRLKKVPDKEVPQVPTPAPPLVDPRELPPILRPNSLEAKPHSYIYYRLPVNDSPTATSQAKDLTTGSKYDQSYYRETVSTPGAPKP